MERNVALECKKVERAWEKKTQCYYLGHINVAGKKLKKMSKHCPYKLPVKKPYSITLPNVTKYH